MPSENNTNDDTANDTQTTRSFFRSLVVKVVIAVCVPLLVGWITEFPKSIFGTPVRYWINTEGMGYGFANQVVNKLDQELQEDCNYPKWIRKLLDKTCVSLVYKPEALKDMVVCQEFDTKRIDPNEVLETFVTQYDSCIELDQSNQSVWEIKPKPKATSKMEAIDRSSLSYACSCSSDTINLLQSRYNK